MAEGSRLKNLEERVKKMESKLSVLKDLPAKLEETQKETLDMKRMMKTMMEMMETMQLQQTNSQLPTPYGRSSVYRVDKEKGILPTPNQLISIDTTITNITSNSQPLSTLNDDALFEESQVGDSRMLENDLHFDLLDLKGETNQLNMELGQSWEWLKFGQDLIVVIESETREQKDHQLLQVSKLFDDYTEPKNSTVMHYCMEVKIEFSEWKGGTKQHVKGFLVDAGWLITDCELVIRILSSDFKVVMKYETNRKEKGGSSSKRGNYEHLVSSLPPLNMGGNDDCSILVSRKRFRLGLPAHNLEVRDDYVDNGPNLKSVTETQASLLVRITKLMKSKKLGSTCFVRRCKFLRCFGKPFIQYSQLNIEGRYLALTKRNFISNIATKELYGENKQEALEKWILELLQELLSQRVEGKQGSRNKAIVGMASLNLDDFFPTTKEEFDIDVPVVGTTGVSEYSPPLFLSLLLVELRIVQEQPLQLTGTLVDCITQSPSSVRASSLQKNGASGFKAGLRKVKIFGSTRKSFLAGESSDGTRCAGSKDAEYNDSFDTDSLDDGEVELDESNGECRALSLLNYGAVGYTNFTGGLSYPNAATDIDVESWVYYKNGSPDAHSLYVEYSTSEGDEPRILPRRERKLILRSKSKAKGEPLLKKSYGEVGSNDIDFDHRQLTSSDDSTFGWNKSKEGSKTSHSLVSEFGDDSFVVGCWESKEITIRDGNLKLQAQVFFASTDQRSERAAGNGVATSQSKMVKNEATIQWLIWWQEMGVVDTTWKDVGSLSRTLTSNFIKILETRILKGQGLSWA